MAILAECPRCHKKQSVRNRICACGSDLMAAKRSKKVRYWVSYRLPGGKQRREPAGFAIEEARVAEGKRKAQKYENPGILEKVPADRMNFSEFIDWYLNLKSVQKLASFKRVKCALGSFKKTFGDRIVSSLKPWIWKPTKASGKKKVWPRLPSIWKSALPRLWSPRLLTTTLWMAGQLRLSGS